MKKERHNDTTALTNTYVPKESKTTRHNERTNERKGASKKWPNGRTGELTKDLHNELQP